MKIHKELIEMAKESNAQWHDDQSIGERALREHKRRSELDSRLGDALRASGINAADALEEAANGDYVLLTDMESYLATALRERDEARAEAARLRKLFDDAGQGEHNVLALIDHYQRNSMEADERLRVVRGLLEENGCDCPCDHHPDERGDDCDVCLACRIGEAVGK